jgi:hypothetical protein
MHFWHPAPSESRNITGPRFAVGQHTRELRSSIGELLNNLSLARAPEVLRAGEEESIYVGAAAMGNLRSFLGASAQLVCFAVLGLKHKKTANSLLK